jgi:hypothetical protein
MNVYRFDDGATYWVAAKNVRGMLRALFAVDADDGWEDIDGFEWTVIDPDDMVTFDMSEATDAKVPRDCEQDDRGRWTATAGAWAETCDGPVVLACSEWP